MSAVNTPPSLSGLGINGISLPSGTNLPSINVIGQDSIGGGQSITVTQNRFFFNDTVSWSVGPHNLKFGGETRRLQRNEIPGSSGSFDFRTTQAARREIALYQRLSIDARNRTSAQQALEALKNEAREPNSDSHDGMRE